MKKNLKRIFAFLFATIMMLSVALPASAAEISDDITNKQAQLVTFEVTSDDVLSIDSNGGISLYSSINGYQQRTLTSPNASLTVPLTGSGTGGMGITVKTSSSWNGYMSMMIADSYNTIFAQNYAIYSNTEVQFHNLTHHNPARMYFIFEGIPSGKSVLVQAWVYG